MRRLQNPLLFPLVCLDEPTRRMKKNSERRRGQGRGGASKEGSGGDDGAARAIEVVPVMHAVITPTKILVKGVYGETGNRVTRQFYEEVLSGLLIRVSFADEDGNPICNQLCRVSRDVSLSLSLHPAHLWLSLSTVSLDLSSSVLLCLSPYSLYPSFSASVVSISPSLHTSLSVCTTLSLSSTPSTLSMYVYVRPAWLY